MTPWNNSYDRIFIVVYAHVRLDKDSLVKYMQTLIYLQIPAAMVEPWDVTVYTSGDMRWDCCLVNVHNLLPFSLHSYLGIVYISNLLPLSLHSYLGIVYISNLLPFSLHSYLVIVYIINLLPLSLRSCVVIVYISNLLPLSPHSCLVILHSLFLVSPHSYMIWQLTL